MLIQETCQTVTHVVQGNPGGGARVLGWRGRFTGRSDSDRHIPTVLWVAPLVQQLTTGKWKFFSKTVLLRFSTKHPSIRHQRSIKIMETTVRVRPRSNWVVSKSLKFPFTERPVANMRLLKKWETTKWHCTSTGTSSVKHKCAGLSTLPIWAQLGTRVFATVKIFLRRDWRLTGLHLEMHFWKTHQSQTTEHQRKRLVRSYWLVSRTNDLGDASKKYLIKLMRQSCRRFDLTREVTLPFKRWYRFQEAWS